MAQNNFQHCKSFDMRCGWHRYLAILVLLGCFTGSMIQLGGVASLQAACPTDLELEKNDVEVVQSFLLSARAMLADPTKPLNQVQTMTLIGGILKSLSVVATRTTSAFTLTPDTHCHEYYRYEWLAFSLQFAVLLLAFFALFTGVLHQARVAICTLLAVSTTLSIQCAHTFYYVKEFAPDLTLERGKVFFAGCTVVAGSNLFLLYVLGLHDESNNMVSPAASRGNSAGQLPHHVQSKAANMPPSIDSDASAQV